MFNLLRNVKYLTEKKVRNPFFATYLFVLLYRNWALIFTLFNFDNDCSLDDKLYMINSYFEDQNFIWEIWTNLWITTLVILFSYLIYFGFRFMANFFERKVFPIADKIDDKLLVTKERHLKVKEDRDNLNKEFEYVRDTNIMLTKNYADIKKELGDYEQLFTINQKEFDELKGEKAKLDDKIIIMNNNLDFLRDNKKALVQSLTRLVNITTRRMHSQDKYLPFLDNYHEQQEKSYMDLSAKDLHWFIEEDLLENTDHFGRVQTLLGSVLYKYHTQKGIEKSKKLNIPQCIEIYLTKRYEDNPFNIKL